MPVVDGRSGITANSTLRANYPPPQPPQPVSQIVTGVAAATSGSEAAFVRDHGSVTAAANTGTLSFTLAFAVPAGNLLTVFCIVPLAAATFTVVDTAGNTWADQLTFGPASGHTEAILASIISTGLAVGDTVTLNVSAATQQPAFTVVEFSGVASLQDAMVTATATAATYDTGVGASPAGGHLLLSAVGMTGAARTATPSGAGTWTALTIPAAQPSFARTLAPFYQIVTDAGTLQNAGSMSASNAYAAGAVSLPGVAIAAGTVTGGGSLTATPATMSADGSLSTGGTGAVAAPTATLTGAGTVSVAGVGALTAGPATLSGSATVTVTGGGSAASSAATLSAAGTLRLTGAGAVAPPPATVAASGTLSLTGTGAASSPPATLAGAGTVAGVGITGTGSLTAPAATLAGAGSVTVTGTGTLTTPAPTLTAAGLLALTGAGAAAASPATLTGTGTVPAPFEPTPPHIYVTAQITDRSVTSALAGTGIGTATLLTVPPSSATLTAAAPATAVTASGGASTATLTGGGASTATVTAVSALAELQLV